MISFISCRFGIALLVFPVFARGGDMMYCLTLEAAFCGCFLRQELCEGCLTCWPVRSGDLPSVGGATANSTLSFF